MATGSSVLDAARDLGVDLDSVCGGRGICGRCQVTPALGDHPTWAITAKPGNLSPRGPQEDAYRGRRPIESDGRLGCAARILGDIVIDVPADSQLHRQIVRKDIDVGDVTLDPLATLHYLELPGPNEDNADNADDAVGDAIADRLAGALARDWNQPNRSVAPRLLADLHRVVASGAVTVAVRNDTIVAIWPGLVDRVYGVAFDVGSTTVAGHLCELTTGEVVATAGRMNPQIRFGEDLMSRVSYAMLNDDGAASMTESIRRALDELTDELVAAAGVDRGALLDVVAVGNPIMHHLLLGIDPTPLGQAPFPLATSDAVVTDAAAIGIDAPNAGLYVAPCIAGHVGADTVAAIGAQGPHRSDAIQLLVDVGTNAEIVLGNRHRLFAASSPTGPAFEGAQISAGQRATAGAIERVRIDRATLEPRFKVIGADGWSDEPGFDPGPAGVDRDLRLRRSSRRSARCSSAGLIDQTGRDRERGRHRNPDGPPMWPDGRTYRYRLTDTIAVTQNDVRAIQLAKAAPCAPASSCSWSGPGSTAVDDDPPRRRLRRPHRPDPRPRAGLGPRLCRRAGPRSVGNAAGSGAVRALLSSEQRRRARNARRPCGHEDRDRHRAALPRPVRRGAGDPPRVGAEPDPGNDRGPAAGRPRRTGGASPPTANRSGRRMHP